MELTQNKKWLFSLTALWLLNIFALGGWWLYLVFNPESFPANRLTHMLKWEGLTFFVLLILLSASIAYLYFYDLKKTKAVQVFFATLGHELKTPLASMRLQAQFIEDISEQSQDAQIKKLSSRLVRDTYKFEQELERAMGLSQLFQKSSLSQTSIPLSSFLLQIAETFPELPLQIEGDEKEILCDEYSLKLVFRNLFENSLKHGENPSVHIILEEAGSKIKLRYYDGNQFEGNHTKMTELFYKHNSPSGSGIGLYLIDRLLKKNGAYLKIQGDQTLIFDLFFKKA